MSGFAFVEYAELKVSLVQNWRARQPLEWGRKQGLIRFCHAVQDAEEAVAQLSGKDFLGER